MPQGPIRILLVDDNPAFVESLTRFISMEPEIEIVGRAHSGRHGVELALHMKPDLVLMDLAMPEMNGVEATREIKAQEDAPQVILLTLHDEPEYRDVAKSVRADGFVPKAELGTQLLEQIYSIFEGKDKLA